MGFSKRCTKCGEVKWWYQFGKRKQGPFSLQSSCKPCIAQRSSIWARKNPEKARESYRKWKDNNPEKVKERCKNYYHKNKFIIKGTRTLKITIPEARSLLYQNRAEVLKVAETARLGKYE
jgi:hypothetical protein